MKTTSSAAIIIVDKKILICKTRFNDRWDFPKGKIEDGETPRGAAIRETKEETNITILPENIIYTSLVYKYTNKKNIIFNICLLNKSDLPEKLECSSTFERYEKVFPEIDEYKFILFEELNDYLYHSLVKVLNEFGSGIKQVMRELIYNE